MSGKAALVIRADAGAAIGTGHVMRSIALAAAWRELGAAVPVTLVSRGSLPAGIEARLRSQAVEIRAIPHADAARDAALTSEIRRETGATWVVVDGYGFDGAYEERLRAEGARVLALDDHGHTRHAADVILNPNLGATAAPYDPVRAGVKVLAGPEFALIRPEFWPYRGRARRARPAVEKVLVTMGGSDAARLTPRVIEGVAGLGLDVRVILGGADPAANEAADLAAKHGFAVVRDAPDMAPPMEWADLTVSAAGVTLLELLFMGVPTLAVVASENQRPGALAAEKDGLVRLLGWHEAVTAETARAGVRALVDDAPGRAALGSRAQAAIDGIGAGRVVNAME